MSEIQKDLILAPNEFAFVLDETKGNVSCNVGPHKMSLSQSDKLVVFDNHSKRFVPCDSYRAAIQLFTICPEGWYVALKNPAPENKHPKPGTSNVIPDNMQIGYKVNVAGPISFALYPGQMAEVIKGHTLRSNQYLVARVYDAESLNKSKAEDEPEYVNGQILIIKGTEVSFYIPPTGIEIKAIENDRNKGYVRDAITLERLEYCILKDEDGNKRYVHGPEVVFPSPTESFIEDGDGHVKRNAIELSDISGVYVKVIADYKDETGEHKTGEELFITGKEQMIYYPRPEHTFITYNGRVMHHAVAIPKGEGRYIMNRMTGEIKTVRGPAMYLPDPRTEVAVKRTLTRSQCALWYPGNDEVLAANGYGSDLTKGGFNLNFDGSFANTIGTFADSTMYAAVNSAYIGTPTKKEKNKITRANTFTPPRTISLNSSKYEGAVAVDVWTGYAVNVISKDGTRKVVRGPQTVLLDYDQTLESLELSTGKPKTTDKLLPVAFLRHENNRVSDIINIETSDFVNAEVKVSYHINFDESMMDKWFSVDNYVKHLCEWGRSVVKKAAKNFSFTEFYASYQDIILAALKDTDEKTAYLHQFTENGMTLTGIEILSIHADATIQAMIDEHQREIIDADLELNAAINTATIEAELDRLNRQKIDLDTEYKQFEKDKQHELRMAEIERASALSQAKEEEDQRVAQAKIELQELQDLIFKAEQDRIAAQREADIAYQTEMDKLQLAKEEAAAKNMETVLTALGPDLAAALNLKGNQAILEKIAESISPYAVATGGSVSDAINKLVRGTTLESVLEKFDK